MIDSETKAKLKQLSDSKGYEKDRYWSRPFLIRENDIIINEEKKSKKLRTESNLWGRDLTKDLANEVKEAYEYNLNTIILLTGLPGLGKTEVGMSLTVFLFIKSHESRLFPKENNSKKFLRQFNKRAKEENERKKRISRKTAPNNILQIF